MMGVKRLDIAVAGCGPAGMAAALLLSRQGHRVRIIERFAAARPIGSGLMLQPTGMAVLSELGLAEQIAERGARIDRLFGRAIGSGRIVLDVRYGALNPGYAGLAVHRAALFDVLAGAVAAQHIEIETAAEVERLERSAQGTYLLTANQRIGPFDLVVDALGARSPLMATSGLAGRPRELAYGALWASLPWPDATTGVAAFDPHALEQRYNRASRMVGVLPLGRTWPGQPPQTAFFWSIKPENHAQWRMRGLDAWKDDVRHSWPETEPFLAAIQDPAQLTLARYSHHTARGAVAERYAAIGDSAHSASPQLGQGANMALLDAWALSLAIEQQTSLAEALASYARSRRWHVRLFQALSFAFTPFYQSDSRLLPVLRDGIAAPLSRLPVARSVLAAMVAGTLGYGLRPLGINAYTSAVGRLEARGLEAPVLPGA
jgi:salicylate hydroxylase